MKKTRYNKNKLRKGGTLKEGVKKIVKEVCKEVAKSKFEECGKNLIKELQKYSPSPETKKALSRLTPSEIRKTNIKKLSTPFTPFSPLSSSLAKTRKLKREETPLISSSRTKKTPKTKKTPRKLSYSPYIYVKTPRTPASNIRKTPSSIKRLQTITSINNNSKGLINNNVNNSVSKKLVF